LREENVYFRPSNTPVLGSVIPCIKIGNHLYYWRGVRNDADPSDIIDSITNPNDHSRSLLPTGFFATASINDVFLDIPQYDYDMVADFDATGMAFTCSEKADVIYVLLHSDRFPEAYYRFTTDTLGDANRISYSGKLYDITPEEWVETLPVGYEPVGQSIVIDKDIVPSSDLETNSFPSYLVFVHCQNHDTIYLEKTIRVDGARKKVYIECNLFE